MSLLDTAFSVESLWESDIQSRKNIKFKYEVQNYELNKLNEINEFRKRYEEGTFEFAPRRPFKLYERGRERFIKPVAYKDRVPIHSFCQNILLKELKKYLIYDNCASIKGKGIDQQLNRLEVFLKRYYMKYKTNEGYVLHIDLRKYFDNIRHDKVIEQISDKIWDEEIIDFMRCILKNNEIDVSYLSDEKYAVCMDKVFNALKHQTIVYKKTGEKMLKKSIGIGNEISQIVGVFFLHPVDNYIKIVKGFKFYGRYMDDLIVIHNNKQDLIDLLNELFVIAKDLGVFINKKKTYIQKLDKPVLFLKTYFLLTETGKVIRWKHKSIFVRERRKLKKLNKKMLNGELKYKDIKTQYRSWRGNISRKKKINGVKTKQPVYHNRRQLQLMDKFYNELFINSFITGKYKEE